MKVTEPLRRAAWVLVGTLFILLALLVFEVPSDLAWWRPFVGGVLIGLATIAFDRG